MALVRVTCWETLFSTELQLGTSCKLTEFISELKRTAFPDLASPSLFYLPDGGYWDSQKVLITSSQQVFDLQEKIPKLTLYLYEDCQKVQLTYQAIQFVNNNSGNPSPYAYNDGTYDEENLRAERHAVATSRGNISARSGTSSISQHNEKFQERVFLRDGDICVFCSSSEELQAAYIIEWDEGCDNNELKALGLKNVYDVRNGLTLCGRCYDVYNQDLVGIKPDNLCLMASKTLMANKLHRTQWVVLNNQQLRFPYDESFHCQWPSKELFEHRFQRFEAENQIEEGDIGCWEVLLGTTAYDLMQRLVRGNPKHVRRVVPIG